MNQEGKAPANYSPQNIEGKVAIVTGGTTGIGRATARLLASRGARVFIFGRDEDDLQSALQEIQSAGGEVAGITADQSKLDDILHVWSEAEKLGRVQIVVNNAAVTGGSSDEISHEEVAYTVQTNLVGYISFCKEAVARMKSNGGEIKGHIVNIGSMSADQREESNDVYVATKAAIQGFSESLRKHVNPEGIKVSLIEPGLIATPMTDGPNRDQEQEVADATMLTPEDIAEAVHYILTQPARCDVVTLQIRPHGQAI